MEIKNKEDCINIKKVYIDITGDLLAGILLSQWEELFERVIAQTKADLIPVPTKKEE